jgi:hypothetical protein
MSMYLPFIVQDEQEEEEKPQRIYDPIFAFEMGSQCKITRSQGEPHLKHVQDTSIKSDKHLVFQYTIQNGYNFQYASTALNSDKNFVIQIVKSKGWLLQYVHDFLRQDRQVVLEAVKQNGNALLYASDLLRADKQVGLEAIRQYPWAIRYVDKNMVTDADILRAFCYGINRHLLSNIVYNKQCMSWLDKNQYEKHYLILFAVSLDRTTEKLRIHCCEYPNDTWITCVS